jgi:pimeloyl-ACP methyl ester carboxylesterase
MRREVIQTSSATGLSVERHGDGAAVVLLHGWCLNGRLWTYAAEALAHEHDVVVPDLAGFGRSSHLGGPYDIDRYAQDLLTLLEELQLEQVAVAGFALGAAVAMAAAQRDDRRIGSIVAVGVPSGAHAPYERMPRSMRRDWPEFARRSAHAICAQPQSDATLAWLASMFGATRLDVAIETVGLLQRFEPVDIADQVRVPALFIHGEDDDVVPTEISLGCAELAPNGSSALIGDAGHLVLLDQKERLLDAVQQFISNH